MKQLFILTHTWMFLTSLVYCKMHKSTTLVPAEHMINPANAKLLSQVNSLNTIAFGSCSKSDVEQVLWDDISATKPDLWIWLGDAIYGDTEDMELMRKKYHRQKQHPGYSTFSQKTPILGIWDDHDYGINNGNKTYVKKAESRDELFSFLDIPQNSVLRKREGAYQSYSFQNEGGSVHVILLDTRYFKDPPVRKNGQYVKDPSIDILGAEQWAWFEKELNINADVTIIANGIQIIPEEHRYEKWANYPSSRGRLLELLESVDSKVILLSGDRHIGEISQMKLPRGRVITEITSSGMTHTYKGLIEESNRHRKGEFTNELNYGLLRLGADDCILELRGNNNSLLQSIKF